MPRGHRRDKAVTRLLRENGFFLDKRSFVSSPRLSDGSVHLILFGDDVGVQRHKLFLRDKETCQKCGRHAPENGQEGFHGEWHHLDHTLAGRCDCLHNAEVRCGAFVSRCHRAEHGG
jgi:hypothetical protein